MIRNYTFCIIFLFPLGVNACNDSSSHSKVELEKNKINQMPLSSKDQAILNEYNQVTQIIVTGDVNLFHQKLKELLPKVEFMSDEKKKKFILMSIYTQLGMDQKAYDLNGEILKQNPTAERQEFQCILMSKLGKKKEDIQNCYSETANKIRNVLKESDIEKDPEYPYILASYYFAMYSSGAIEYKLKMRKIVEEQKNDEIKERLTYFYQSKF